VDVGLEVPNHVKFYVCFYLFFCSYLWVCFRLKRLFLVRDFPTVVSEPMVETGSNECSMVLVSKVFLTRVSGKACPVKKNGGTKKEYSWLGCFRWRGNVPMWLKGLTLEGEIVRNPSVSLSPTLTRIEKVEHYIRIKTHKPFALRFWVESGVSTLCG